ncbi:MAG: DUF2278 family protein [Myxococcales bacterium]|nr:DUF2278 family protein [Myxococcales bacterium]
MPIARYGVFKGRPIARILGEGQNPHYQVHAIDPASDGRLAINVKSKVEPSELLYAIVEDLQHPLTARLRDLPQGFTPLASEPGGLALDYVRGGLVDRAQMVVMPFADAGPGDDLYDRLDALIIRAIGDGEAVLYAWGASWAGEAQKDKYFGFHPGAGVHDVHMNQGNAANFAGDDGTWQDGGLLLNIRRSDGRWLWTAVFLAFQSQSWKTDDHGHTIAGDDAGAAGVDVGDVRIVAATIDAAKGAGSLVTLINASADAIALAGWSLLTYDGARHPIDGELAAGGVLTLALDARLGAAGDALALVDAAGRRIDAVAYSRAQVPRRGRALVFR